jgi:hypothetical protein
MSKNPRENDYLMLKKAGRFLGMTFNDSNYEGGYVLGRLLNKKCVTEKFLTWEEVEAHLRSLPLNKARKIHFTYVPSQEDPPLSLSLGLAALAGAP